MTGMQAALLLLTLTGLGCVGMVSFVIERKLRRDKREFVSRTSRERLREALEAGDQSAIRTAAACACEDSEAQVDFAVTASGTVDSLSADELDRMHDTVARIGLIDSLIEQLRHRGATDRGRAVFLLGELRVPEATAMLRPLLADPDPDVRLVAAAELGGIATQSAALALIEGLIADDLTAERIIERLGGRWAVPSMVSVLEDPELARSLAPTNGEISERWRPAVARALGVAADPRAELAQARMLDSPEVEERVAAARALGPSGSEASIAVLVAALEDEAWEVRAQAAKSLACHPDDSAVPALEGKLSDEAWWVRSNAADTLAEIGTAGIKALKRTLSHSDRFARDRAQEALALHHLAEA
jgi:HEAT repeat protein